MTISRINFQCLPVTDQDRALKFYTENLNFTIHTDTPYGEGWRWIFLTLPGAETRLQFSRANEVQFNGVPALCLASDDVDADAKRFEATGVTISQGPDDAPWMPGVRWLMIRDSEDNLILLESMKV